jgi:hypothetical protein
MSVRNAVFAVPGDPETRTGGYIYDARVLAALRAQGRDVTALRLPDGFPLPDAGSMKKAGEMLRALGPDRPVIIDGLALGAIDPSAVTDLRAPLVGLVHHPLALETGLSAAQAERLARTEAANLARAAHVIVPSPHTGDVLARDYRVPRDRITVARPGIDRPDQSPRPATPPLILTVGSLAPRKGHDVLLQALVTLKDLEWRAVIVGRAHDPAEGDALRALSDRLGLAERVRFAGELDQTALDALYRQASLFALATRYEGYGMVFAEALVNGLPIVSCRAGAVPGTVPPDAGTLVPPDDPAAFAAALRALLEDMDLRATRSAAAARCGAELPTWEDTAALFGAVIDGL